MKSKGEAMHVSALRAIAIIAVLLAPCAHAQRIYKCTEDGAVVYQDGPCSDLQGKVVDTRPASKGFEAPKVVAAGREQPASRSQPQAPAPASGPT